MYLPCAERIFRPDSIGGIRGEKVASLIRKRNYRSGWRNRNSLSPLSPPRGSRGKRDAVTWRWISFSLRPISTDFHNGSTYECTHLSPTPARALLDPSYSRYPARTLVQPPSSLQPSVCSFSYSLIETLVLPVVLARNAAGQRRDNCAGTWLIFGFAHPFYVFANTVTILRRRRELRR